MVCHGRTSNNIKNLKLKSRVNRKQEIAPKQSNISLPNNSHDFLKNVKPKLLGKSKGCKNKSNNYGFFTYIVSFNEVYYIPYPHPKKKYRRTTIQKRFRREQKIGNTLNMFGTIYTILKKV